MKKILNKPQTKEINFSKVTLYDYEDAYFYQDSVCGADMYDCNRPSCTN